MSFVPLPQTLKLLDAWWSFIHGIQHRLRYLPMQPETTDMHASTANITIHGVPRGNYTMLVFDGEYNSLLSERAATAPQKITVTDGCLEPVVDNFLIITLTHYMMSDTMQYIITSLSRSQIQKYTAFGTKLWFQL